MNIEPVASVDDGNTHAALECRGSDAVGKMERIFAAVQSVEPAGWKRELFGQERRGNCFGGGGHRVSSRLSPEDVLRHFCRIVKTLINIFVAYPCTTATIRTGPPLPPAIFMGRAITVKFFVGNRLRLATFSRAGMFFSNSAT